MDFNNEYTELGEWYISRFSFGHKYDIILLNLFDNDNYHIWYEKIEPTF